MISKKLFFFCFCVTWLFHSCLADKKNVAFYVSPDGNDLNAGTKEAPFSNIRKAQEAVQEIKQENGIPNGGITIYLRQGIYPVRQTLHFNRNDSGRENAPVIYKAFPGEEVLLAGGEVVDHFVPLVDEEAKSRINPRYHEHIVQTNLKKSGITDYGKIKPTGFGRELQPSGLELFFNGEPMTLARYPNEGEWLRIVSVPQQGNKLFNEGSHSHKRFGIPTGRHFGKFKYDGRRPAGWKKNREVWLHGYWTWDWADSYVKVDRIDTTRKEFILAEPHGVYGYTQEQRYYALNILEELDSPGEWYLDRKNGMLFFWPPSSIDKGITIASVLEDLMVHIDHADYVHFEGIVFECSRGEAIKIEGGSHNLIAGCTIRNMGSNGVRINGGHNNGIKSCDIYNTGDGGIVINGGDRKKLTPAGNYAVNNHIRHYSRINKTYRPAIQMNGVGNYLAHNYIHDAPHAGILFGGNENLLEFNEIHNIAKETGDVGAFYIGRDWTQRGNVIRHNYFHHLHGPGLHGVMAVYLDDAASGTTIYGNVFYQAGRSAFVGGGHDNIVENNVFVECNPSIHLDARGLGWASEFIQKGGSWQMYKKLKDVSHKQPPYSVKYPSLEKILELDNPAMPSGNVFRANISYGGKWSNIDPRVEKVIIENNHVEKEVPGYVDVENGKLYPQDEMILNEIGFKKIPFDSIGLYTDAYRHSVPAPKITP